MRTSPRKNLLDFIPIAYVFKGELLNRSTCDDQAVKLLATHFIEIAIEHHHMLYRRVFRRMTLEFHEADFHLQRRVGEQTHEICFCGTFQGHKIQNGYTQRTDVLCMSPGIAHHEDVFLLQQVYCWQSIR